MTDDSLNTQIRKVLYGSDALMGNSYVKAIKALIQAERIKAQREVFNLFGEPRCDQLHHTQKHQHKALGNCPVEVLINAMLAELDTPNKDTK